MIFTIAGYQDRVIQKTLLAGAIEGSSLHYRSVLTPPRAEYLTYMKIKDSVYLENYVAKILKCTFGTQIIHYDKD